ncbi:MAG: 50S ribosomal protein L11 methyltransferase [Bryobacterales bacterium]|nr:50S ribosomal protein L11 methyltransferase [Bryobacterales bacterium]
MWVVTWEGPADQADWLLCEDGLAGAEEIELDGGHRRLRLFFSDAVRAREVARHAAGTIAWESDEPPLAYQQQWAPIPVGRRFFLRPPWLIDQPPPGRIELIMQPGAIFGSGDHATTQLCLILLGETVTPGDIVIDAGTGTGILGIAAGLLGAERVYAFDLDPAAVTMSRRSVEEAGTTVHLWAGSWDSCRGGVATGLVANLPGGLLLDAVSDLLPLVRPGGWMILSGILPEHRPPLEQKLGARPLRWREQDGWLGLVAQL